MCLEFGSDGRWLFCWGLLFCRGFMSSSQMQWISSSSSATRPAGPTTPLCTVGSRGSVIVGEGLDHVSVFLEGSGTGWKWLSTGLRFLQSPSIQQFNISRDELRTRTLCFLVASRQAKKQHFWGHWLDSEDDQFEQLRISSWFVVSTPGHPLTCKWFSVLYHELLESKLAQNQLPFYYYIFVSKLLFHFTFLSFIGLLGFAC